MPSHSHVFDELNAWAQLPATRLESQFSSESAAKLAECASLLLATPFVASQVTESTFPAQVAQLRRALHEASRALGDAIIRSGELQDAGNLPEASLVLTTFLNQCGAPFHRSVALAHLSHIECPNGA